MFLREQPSSVRDWLFGGQRQYFLPLMLAFKLATFRFTAHAALPAESDSAGTKLPALFDRSALSTNISLADTGCKQKK